MKLIYADAVIDAIEQCKTARTSDGEIYVAKINAIMRIDALPPAQPMQKKGKWIKISPTKLMQKKGKWIKISPANIYECSVCGQNVITADIDAYRFCHGCGADMRGEQDG